MTNLFLNRSGRAFSGVETTQLSDILYLKCLSAEYKTEIGDEPAEYRFIFHGSTPIAMLVYLFREKWPSEIVLTSALLSLPNVSDCDFVKGDLISLFSKSNIKASFENHLNNSMLLLYVDDGQFESVTISSDQSVQIKMWYDHVLDRVHCDFIQIDNELSAFMRLEDLFNVICSNC